MATIVDKATLRVVTRSGNTPDYPTADFLINPAGLAALEAVPEKYRKLNGTSDDMEEMSAAEKTVVDDSGTYLTPEKARRVQEINARTDALEAAGFEYPASSGRMFALDGGARENWIVLKQAADAGLLGYPQTVGTKDYDDYSLADATELTTFYATALGTGKAYREAGQALRKLIRNATTRAAVDAVVDTR